MRMKLLGLADLGKGLGRKATAPEKPKRMRRIGILILLFPLLAMGAGLHPDLRCRENLRRAHLAAELKKQAPRWRDQIETLLPGVRPFDRDGIATFYGPNAQPDSYAARALLEGLPVKHLISVTHQLKRLETATAEFIAGLPFAGAPVAVLADVMFPLTNPTLGAQATLIHMSGFGSHGLSANAEVIHLFGGAAQACLSLTADNWLLDTFSTQVRRESVTLVVYPHLVYNFNRTLAEKWKTLPPDEIKKSMASVAGSLVNPWLNHRVDEPELTAEGNVHTFRYLHAPRTIRVVFAPVPAAGE